MKIDLMKNDTYSESQLTGLVILRILIGWHFLYEGISKLINPFKKGVVLTDIHLSNEITGYVKLQELPLIISLIITLYIIFSLGRNN